MQKLFIIILAIMLVCTFVTGCGTAVDYGHDTVCNIECSETQAIVDNAEPLVEYDAETDYMNEMIRSASRNDMSSLEKYIAERNEKIKQLDLPYDILSVDGFLERFEEFAGFSLDVDYLQIMKDSCVSGNIEAGVDAENKRNKKIEALEIYEYQISMYDLMELSKIITAEAGSSWLPSEWKMMVGEVVMNRVNSSEFPNTIYDVVHQSGQYANANTSYFDGLLPFEDCVDVAVRLLYGERVMYDASVVFQSGSTQGSGVHTKLYDSHYGYTYFCYSSYPALYD